MTDQTKALLPVTQADRELAQRLCYGMSEKAIGEAAMLIARHRISHSLPGDGMREALERTLTDPQRLLWRDDVEGICPTPGACWEYGDTARCGPCAIKQAEALGIVSDMSVPNLPEVYRLRRELASRTLPDAEALANELDAFVLVRTNDAALAIEVGNKVRAALTPSPCPGDVGDVR